jgi:hypothetical protein
VKVTEIFIAGVSQQQLRISLADSRRGTREHSKGFSMVHDQTVCVWLSLAEWCENLLAQVGARFTGPIAIIRNWTYCLFYVMAELWGSVVVSVLFWGFANQITTVEEASQFYPLFGLGANVALIFSGQAVKYFSMVCAG